MLAALLLSAAAIAQAQPAVQGPAALALGTQHFFVSRNTNRR